MLEFFETGKALSVFMAISTIGIVSKLITRSLYKRLLKETENMAMTKNKNLKALKQKLENAYRLNQNIVNTQAYLDKQIYGFKFMHISLNGWNNLSLQMTILGLLAGGICSFMSYWFRLDSYYIILYAAVGALGSLLLTFLDSSFNISLKQQRLSNTLLEYVDNSVFVRVARENAVRENAVRENAVRENAVRENTARENTVRENTGRENTGRENSRDYAAASRDLGIPNAESERENLIRENEFRDGLVHDDEERRSARNSRNRNIKAEELLRTVRNIKNEEMELEEGASHDVKISRPERGPALRTSSINRKNNFKTVERKEEKPNSSAVRSAYTGGDREQSSESCREIDYLKHSLEQIAASKEKNRVNDDWAKNLDAGELKVIGEIMRQYFSNN